MRRMQLAKLIAALLVVNAREAAEEWGLEHDAEVGGERVKV